jgi:hypothetical protein
VYSFLAGKHQGVVDAEIGAEEEAPLDLHIVRVTFEFTFSNQNIERHASIKNNFQLRCTISTGLKIVCSQLAFSSHFKLKWKASMTDTGKMRMAYQPTPEGSKMR